MHCSFHVWFKYVMQLRNLHLREEREFLGSLRFRWEHQYRAGNTLAMMIFLVDFLINIATFHQEGAMHCTLNLSLQSMSSKGILGLSGLNNDGKVKVFLLDSASVN